MMAGCSGAAVSFAGVFTNTWELDERNGDVEASAAGSTNGNCSVWD
jgi:hypothetical protein